MTQVDPATNVPLGPSLTREDEHHIHRAACAVVAAAVHENPRGVETELESLAAARTQLMGAFVTLKRQGRLRACCGTLGRPMPLSQAVAQAAWRTGSEDSRFPSISPTELPFLELDVTLLFGFETITARGHQRREQIELGRHGLQVKRGQHAGLLLPSVPVEWGWNVEQFLEHVCRKAGLPGTAWRDDPTQLQRFEGHAIHGDFQVDAAAEGVGEKPARFSPDELAELAEQTRQNLLNLLRGATPNYYLPGCPDGPVPLVSIHVTWPEETRPLQFARMSLRPGLPLQSTLFQLAQAAAARLQAKPGDDSLWKGVGLGLTLLSDPAMHGTVAAPDLRGIDPSRRALLVVEGSQHVWRFDPQQSPEELLESALHEIRVSHPETASIFSLAAVSTRAPSTMATPLPAVDGPAQRPAAVAGSFYPGDPAAMSQAVERLLETEPVEPERWPAALVPHAGWTYSGRLAAATLQRVQIPPVVFILAPKHSAPGPGWAVAPHRSWAIPGGTVPGDPDLAVRLAQAVPGLELDAAAHQQEHAIEVQLPLLARLAPHTRVVGLVMSASDWEACHRFATGLAEFLRGLPEQPLLLISSDLHHFASEAESRRLDEIALQAIETLDPPHVLETIVQRYQIKMCGVSPCVTVMETLRQLGQLDRCERVGYTTSAEASGDTRRVVGYGGLLLGGTR